VIEPWEMHAFGVGIPHTTHCLADGNVMISTLIDGPEKNGKGNFILLDGETFKPKGTWTPGHGYDIWYQPYHNVMISKEWGHPRCFFKGLDLADVENGSYGTHLSVYDWKELWFGNYGLGMEGVMPLEIR
jgi:selenium-binding protein 1